MARRANAPTMEIEIEGSGGLKIEVHDDEGRSHARLVVPGMEPSHMPCIGTGLSPRTCLRDVKTFLTQALQDVDHTLEDMK